MSTLSVAHGECGGFTCQNLIYQPIHTRRVQKVKIQRSEACTTFLICKSDTVNELPIYNFIFKHSHWHCPNNY